MRFFIGYDQSRKYVHDYCTKNLSIEFEKIGSSVLSENIWYRKRQPTDSTEFSVCRFLVPYLSKFEGWSVFMDDDFVWKVSPTEVEQYCDNSYSVLVCKHNYVPKKNVKWNNINQLKYEKKNWSSLMLFNNSHPDCRKLNVNPKNTLYLGDHPNDLKAAHSAGASFIGCLYGYSLGEDISDLSVKLPKEIIQKIS